MTALRRTRTLLRVLGSATFVALSDPVAFAQGVDGYTSIMFVVLPDVEVRRVDSGQGS